MARFTSDLMTLANVAAAGEAVLPIGSVVDLAASSNIVDNKYIRANGASYLKKDWPDLATVYDEVDISKLITIDGANSEENYLHKITHTIIFEETLYIFTAKAILKVVDDDTIAVVHVNKNTITEDLATSFCNKGRICTKFCIVGSKLVIFMGGYLLIVENGVTREIDFKLAYTASTSICDFDSISKVMFCDGSTKLNTFDIISGEYGTEFAPVNGINEVIGTNIYSIYKVGANFVAFDSNRTTVLTSSNNGAYFTKIALTFAGSSTFGAKQIGKYLFTWNKDTLYRTEDGLVFTSCTVTKPGDDDSICGVCEVNFTGDIKRISVMFVYRPGIALAYNASFDSSVFDMIKPIPLFNGVINKSSTNCNGNGYPGCTGEYTNNTQYFFISSVRNSSVDLVLNTIGIFTRKSIDEALSVSDSNYWPIGCVACLSRTEDSKVILGNAFSYTAGGSGVVYVSIYEYNLVNKTFNRLVTKPYIESDSPTNVILRNINLCAIVKNKRGVIYGFVTGSYSLNPSFYVKTISINSNRELSFYSATNDDLRQIIGVCVVAHNGTAVVAIAGYKSGATISLCNYAITSDGTYFRSEAHSDTVKSPTSIFLDMDKQETYFYGSEISLVCPFFSTGYLGRHFPEAKFFDGFNTTSGAPILGTIPPQSFIGMDNTSYYYMNNGFIYRIIFGDELAKKTQQSYNTNTLKSIVKIGDVCFNQFSKNTDTNEQYHLVMSNGVINKIPTFENRSIRESFLTLQQKEFSVFNANSISRNNPLLITDTIDSENMFSVPNITSSTPSVNKYVVGRK